MFIKPSSALILILTGWPYLISYKGPVSLITQVIVSPAYLAHHLDRNSELREVGKGSKDSAAKWRMLA